MDNISRRLSCEDTATSMYLSFDAESTMSTACYKTLEAMSDISALSSIDMENSVTKSENHINSTLEAQDTSQVASPLTTIKKIDKTDIKLHTPLRALPKNILKEYKALCSTPSKEQLLKSVDVNRGSDANRCIDLGLAFLGVDDEKPAYFPPPSAVLYEENKENAAPGPEEVSTLSICSSVEITTSVIERKLLSTACSTTEEESIDEMKNIEEIVVSTDAVDKNLSLNSSLLSKSINMQIVKETENVEDFIQQDNDHTPKDNVENIEYRDTLLENKEKLEELPSLVKELEITEKSPFKKSCSKQTIAVLTNNARRSIYEPNFQINKPSRLYDFNSESKRQSLLPTSRKSTIVMNAQKEIPLLMNKMQKISNNTPAVKLNEQQVVLDHKLTPSGKRRGILATKEKRTSLISSGAGDKRPFSYTQRMSVVVKTTLNSPARKMGRKSSIGTIKTSLQRSVIPQKNTATDSKIKKPEVIARKSILPRTSTIPTINKSNTKTMNSLKEITSKPTASTLTKNIEKTQINSVGSISNHNKPDITYNCNICNEKFRIKSLLDAHKRSHESDNIPPAFLKKTAISLATPSASILGNTNQCKYCDKKFALTRALHIHLLQNCSKIPPSEKRKLLYTDLNHVEKAQLPNVFTHHNFPSNASSVISSTNPTPRQALKQNAKKIYPKSSTESLNEIKDIKKITTDLETSADGTTTTASQKKVKNLAHAGVYRTPSKSVPCHLCKLMFKSILDYTNHNLSVHGSNKTNTNKGICNDFNVEYNLPTGTKLLKGKTPT